MKTVIPKTFPLYASLLVCSFVASGQNNTIDSLLKALQAQKVDTNKVKTLNELAYSYRNTQPDTGVYYARQALALAEKLNWKMGIAKSYKCIGNNYYSLGDAATALEFFQQALTINKKLGDKIATGEIISNIATVYISQSDYRKALSYCEEALNLFQELKYNPGIITNFANMGTIYFNLGDYPVALEYLHKTLILSEKEDNKLGIAKTLGNLGTLYTELKNYSKALEYCKKALSIHEQLGNKLSMGIVLSSIGIIYSNFSDYSNALKYYKKSLDMYEQVGDKAGIGQCFSNIGETYFRSSEFIRALEYNQKSYKISAELGDKWNMSLDLYNIAEIYLKADNSSLLRMGIPPDKRLSKAIEKLNTSLKIAHEIEAPDLQRDAFEALSRAYEKQRDYRKAYSNYKNYILLRDSILNDDKKRELTQKEFQYEYDKKEAAIKAEQEKKNALAAAEIKNQKLVRNFTITGAVAILSFSGIGFYRYRRRKRLQSQQALMNERLRISRELHDEVGATLSGIAMYSHLTKEQIKHANTSEVEKSLSIMQQSADEMVNKLNDIVWLLKPEQDSLQKLIKRLEEYARDMAMIKKMHMKINVPEKLAEHSLPMESRRNIYLFCKEAINNAVKYSKGTLLALNVKETNGILEFSVSDNGKGFDPATIKRGNGLENMQKRADEIGARLNLQSKQNEGSLVSMQLKIT